MDDSDKHYFKVLQKDTLMARRFYNKETVQSFSMWTAFWSKTNILNNYIIINAALYST